MSILQHYSMLLLNIHGMPCVNKCRHCWAMGSPDYPTMPLPDIVYVLESLAEFRDRNEVWAMPLFFKEPTIHPEFTGIVRSMKEHGFINQATFWATNGYGLARMNDEKWQFMKKVEIGGLQLMLYGNEDTHDRFAGRPGAYSDIQETIDKANRFDISWSGGMIAHGDNLAEIRPAIRLLMDKNPNKGARFGWMISNYQGRGIGLKRPTLEQMTAAGLLEQENRWWRSESTHVREILADAKEGAQRHWQIGCNALTLDVEADLDVYCGGGCDSNGLLGLMPELKGDLKLGNLRDQPLSDMVGNFFAEPPKPLRQLWDMTAGELADKYGDPMNAELFHRDDLVKNKWGAMALRGLAH